MENAEALSNEIKYMKNKIYELEKRIKIKTVELENACPHIRLCKIYDDDYHTPHFYNKCLTCGEELQIK
jgi:hypothetical protein